MVFGTSMPLMVTHYLAQADSGKGELAHVIRRNSNRVSKYTNWLSLRNKAPPYLSTVIQITDPMGTSLVPSGTRILAR